MNNPLQQYFKVPKLYVKLPSKAQFYDAAHMEVSANQEVAVYALSARDQILLKTPDALLNGETLIQIMSNCVPGIKHIEQLVEPDINTLLLAIKVATQGSKSELQVGCPNCQKEQTFEINLTELIEHQSFMEDEPSVELSDSLIVKIKPFNFEQRNLSLINEIEEGQAVKLMQDDQSLNTDQQAKQIAQIVSNMTDRMFQMVAKSVLSVTIVETGQVVTDPDHIREFIMGITKYQADAITSKVKELNMVGISSDQKFMCTSCNHEWTHSMDFNPLSFFE
jgi:transposase-like protein